MISLIRKNIRLWGCQKALALFAGCLLFSLSSRYGNETGFEQHILSAVSDHYYLTYFLLPLVLLSCFSFLEDDSEQAILRFGSYDSYFRKKWLATGSIAAVITAVQTAAILLSGVGLNRHNSWIPPQNAACAELFAKLQPHFPNPLVAFVLFTVYQLLGIWFVFGLCIWTGHFAGRRRAARIVTALYVLSALWMKIPALQEIPVTGLNHLIILYHNFTAPYRFALTGITAVILWTLMLLSLRFTWRPDILQHAKKRQGITAYYKKTLVTNRSFLVLCTVVFCITLYKGLGNTYPASGEEWIYALFLGHGTGCFQILPFLELLIVNSIPLYLLAIFVEQTISGQSMFIFVRTESRRKVLSGILAASISFLALYVFLWLIGSVLGSIVFGYGFHTAAGKILLSAAGLRFLDLLLQYLAMLFVSLLTRQITAGFLMLVAGNMLCFIPARWTGCLPFGLSSTARIRLHGLGTGMPAVMAALILAALSFYLLLLLKCFGYRKL